MVYRPPLDLNAHVLLLCGQSVHQETSIPSKREVLTDVALDRSIPALDSDETRNAVPYPLLFDGVLEPQ